MCACVRARACVRACVCVCVCFTYPFFQFAVGWWFVIDACAERAEPVYAAFHICGIFSTIALLM